MSSRKSKWEQTGSKSVKYGMKKNVLKIAGLAVALVALGAFCVVGLKAQQNKSHSSRPSMATNWIGYVVFGTEDSLDQITRGAYPRADPQVEIGLRSDGMVVWRRTRTEK
jgi:hypothetical protein